MIDYQQIVVDGVLTAFGELWWLFAIAGLVAIARTPVVKGWIGEALVRVSARIALKPSIYRAFHDVTLARDGGTTQIDHIFVSPYGVFVVETKNMRGWIFGSERQANWTQKIYRSSRRFQNPLRQNYGHTEAIRELLELEKGAVHSIVVFAGGSTFKTPMPDNVVHGGGYIRYIRRFRERVFDDEQVRNLCDRIANGRLAQTWATHRAHVQSVESRKGAAEAPACPKCGETTMLRHIKRGERAGERFWGCSKFPKCRGAIRYDAVA